MKRLYNETSAKGFARDALKSNARLRPRRQAFHKICTQLAAIGPKEKTIAAMIAAQTLYLDEILGMRGRLNDLYFARLEERLEGLEARQVALGHAIKALTGYSEGLIEAIDQIGVEVGVNLSELGQRVVQARVAAEEDIRATREGLDYAIEGLHRQFDGGAYEESLRTEIEETKRLAREARDEAERAADEPHVIYR